jgi:hypothetical protein
MGTSLAELVVNLTAKADGYNKTFGDAKGTASSLGDHIGGVVAGIGKALVGVGIATGTALVGGLTASVVAASEAQDAVSQLDAVIKSTGGAAGLTRDELTDLAGSLQMVTKFGDEAVIGAESMLLTFTNIGKTVFPEATKTALDMSQALGQDLKSSSIQLGKALNDPIAGISALSRVGVTFTDGQKDMIKALVEAGDVMGAQKVILAELNKEFGGSAEAAGKTFTGQLEIAKNMIGEFAEAVGAQVLPVITPLISRFIEFAQSALPQVQAQLKIIVPLIGDALGRAVTWVVENFPKIRDTVVGVFNDVVAWITANVVPIFDNILIPAFNAVVAYVVANWPTWRDFVIGIFNSVVGWVIANWPIFRDAVIGTFNDIVNWVTVNVVPVFTDKLLPAFRDVLAWAVANWPAVRDAVIGAFNTIVEYVTGTVVPFVENTIVPAFNTAVQWVITNWPVVRDTVIGAFNAVIAWFNTNIVPFVNDTVIPAFNKVVAWVQTNWPLILAKVSEVFNAVIGFVNNTLLPFINTTVIPLFESVVKWVQDHWGEIGGKAQSVFDFLAGLVKGVLQSDIVQFAIAQFKKVTDWVTENWPLIQKAVASVIAFLNGKGPGQGAGGLDTFKNIFETVFASIALIVGTALDIILDVLKLALQLMAGDTAGAGETLKKLFADIFYGILIIVGGVVDVLGEIARATALPWIDSAANIEKAFVLAFKSIYDHAQVLLPIISALNPAAGLSLNTAFGNGAVFNNALANIDAAARELKASLGTGKIDVLGSLGITKEGLYDLLGVKTQDNTPRTVIGGVNGFNGAATQQELTNYNNQFNITTTDNPQSIADVIKRELKLQQTAAVAP